MRPDPAASPPHHPPHVPALIPHEGPPPEGLCAAPLHIVARRLTHPEGWLYQWPGFYAEADFQGDTAWLRLGPGRVRLRLWVDGTAWPDTVTSTPGLHRLQGLTPGRHRLRVEVLGEYRDGPRLFGGLWLPAGTHAWTQTARARQIEFIGDSHTVGYGNTATQRECSDEEVWLHTDPTKAYGPQLAARVDADYRLTAISGRGVVRNHDGHAAPTLPEVWGHALADPASPRADDDPHWRPQVLVLALGTNDFSTPLRPGERWPSRATLQADYRHHYAALLATLRARHPQALQVVWANEHFDGEIQAQAQAVVQQRQATGDERVHFLPISGLAMSGCRWHPSSADHREVAARLGQLLDGVAGVWG